MKLSAALDQIYFMVAACGTEASLTRWADTDIWARGRIRRLSSFSGRPSEGRELQPHQTIGNLLPVPVARDAVVPPERLRQRQRLQLRSRKGNAGCSPTLSKLHSGTAAPCATLQYRDRMGCALRSRFSRSRSRMSCICASAVRPDGNAQWLRFGPSQRTTAIQQSGLSESGRSAHCRLRGLRSWYVEECRGRVRSSMAGGPVSRRTEEGFASSRCEVASSRRLFLFVMPTTAFTNVATALRHGPAQVTVCSLTI